MVPTGIVVDLGAFAGDTVEEYVRRGLGGSRIYAFEPDERNRLMLSRRIKRLQSEWNLDDEGIAIIAAGVSSETGVLCFHRNERSGAASTLSQQGEEEIQVYALDDFFEGKHPPTLIKSDIEGAEKDMLRGAAGLIQKYKPKMALSMYHLADDFVRMPEMIHDMNSAYSFAVRTHTTSYHDTVLYCY